MVQPARFQSLQTEMEGRLFERREEIEGLILAVLSRQHILLVGPKGAAKSMMIRMLAGSIQGAHYFERLLTRRSEEHTSELQSRLHLVCRLLLEKKKKINKDIILTVNTDKTIH